jgi:hypothetical protein
VGGDGNQWVVLCGYGPGPPYKKELSPHQIAKYKADGFICEPGACCVLVAGGPYEGEWGCCDATKQTCCTPGGPHCYEPCPGGKPVPERHPVTVCEPGEGSTVEQLTPMQIASWKAAGVICNSSSCCTLVNGTPQHGVWGCCDSTTDSPEHPCCAPGNPCDAPCTQYFDGGTDGGGTGGSGGAGGGG